MVRKRLYVGVRKLLWGSVPLGILWELVRVLSGGSDQSGGDIGWSRVLRIALVALIGFYVFIELSGTSKVRRARLIDEADAWIVSFDLLALCSLVWLVIASVAGHGAHSLAFAATSVLYWYAALNLGRCRQFPDREAHWFLGVGECFLAAIAYHGAHGSSNVAFVSVFVSVGGALVLWALLVCSKGWSWGPDSRLAPHEE